MKTYKAVFNSEVKGVYGISLVHDPAMEGNFLAFGKQEEIKFATYDEEKRMLLGLVLEPNKLVHRNQGGEEFQVFFDEKGVEDVAHNFQKQSYQSNSTIGHSGVGVEGVTFVETWTSADLKIDKSAMFGLEYAKGSWLTLMKVDNEEVWNEYVKTGKVRGFSIDAAVQFEEVNSLILNKSDMSEQKESESGVSKAVSLFKLALSELVKGKETIEEETKEEEVKAVAETVEEVKEEVKEEVVEMAAETKEEVKEEKEVSFSKEDVAELSLSMQKVVDEAMKPLVEKNLELSKTVEGLNEKIVLLSKQPAAQPIKKVAEQLDFSKMTNFQKLKYNEANR